MTDALTEILKEGGQQPPAPGAENADNAMMERFEAMEAKMAALADENQKLKTAMKFGGIPAKGPDAAELGVPYTGDFEMMIHPVTGHDVKIKTDLVESAIEQGFKLKTAKKK